jgi:hypothetical protein
MPGAPELAPNMRLIALLPLLMAAIASDGLAQDSSIHRTATRFRCVFTANAGHADIGEPKDRDTTIAFTLDEIDRNKGSARRTESKGAELVDVIESPSHLVFVQRSGGGAAHVTFVFRWQKKEGGFVSAHLVHTTLSSLFPARTQLLGVCHAH